MGKTLIGRLSLASLGAAWLLVVLGGTFWMIRFQMTPNKAAAASALWPRDASLSFDTDRPTLIMFLHPHCSCSRASLAELEQALTRCQNSAAVHLVFLQTSDQSPDWLQTDLWRSANAIGGATVHVDHDGSLARQFGAFTSGQVLLYNAKGDLLFNGGITDGRDHMGDNNGLDAVVRLLREPNGAGLHVESAPVFGCSLNNPTTLPIKE